MVSALPVCRFQVCWFADLPVSGLPMYRSCTEIFRLPSTGSTIYMRDLVRVLYMPMSTVYKSQQRQGLVTSATTCLTNTVCLMCYSPLPSVVASKLLCYDVRASRSGSCTKYFDSRLHFLAQKLCLSVQLAVATCLVSPASWTTEIPRALCRVRLSVL